MGYQPAIHCETATAITIGIHAKDLIYKQSIQRRLWGRLVSLGDQCQWTLHGRSITIHVHRLVGNTTRMKIARDTTQVEFDTIRPRCQLAPEDEKDIYLTTLTDMMRSSFENSEAYRTLGIPVAKSILIHGVSGVGKTRLVQCASETLASTVYDISIHDLLAFNDQEYDVPEFMHYNPFTLLLEKAKSNAPATLIVRHLDALLVGDKTNKILDIISKGIDGIQDTTPVCIVGLARHLTALPESLRKTDIFRQHMTLPIPTLPQRKALLHVFLKDMDLKPTKDTTTATTLNYYATQISMRTSGYVARDLKRLVRQAKLKAMRSNMDIADQLEQLSLAASSTSGKVAMAWCDFEYALDTYRPSQRAEVESTLPKRSWDDMGGYTAIKDRMKQAILLPLLQPHVFTKLGIKPPSGLLLYGPSGCGKTALVQALVSESMMNIISIRGPEIFSKYLGETENKLRKLFATAKRIAPCIVFIDEMDAIGTKRGFDMGDSGSGGGVNERVLSTLLNEMDGVENRQGVVVIGCTNRPDQMDDAILRPGRLDQLVHVGLPSLQDRIDIIHALLKKTATQGIDVQALASQTEFCSGADLENLFREAGTAALRKDLNASCITPDDIASVIVPICERAEDQVLEGRLDLYEKFLHDHSL